MTFVLSSHPSSTSYSWMFNVIKAWSADRADSASTDERIISRSVSPPSVEFRSSRVSSSNSVTLQSHNSVRSPRTHASSSLRFSASDSSELLRYCIYTRIHTLHSYSQTYTRTVETPSAICISYTSFIQSEYNIILSRLFLFLFYFVFSPGGYEAMAPPTFHVLYLYF